MNFVYLTALIGLDIKGTLRSPVELRANTFITNNPAVIKKFLKPHDIITIGALEANLLLNGAPVIYKSDSVTEPTVAHTELVNFLREVQAFLTSLWMMEDNSANCELAFAVAQGSSHIHSNSLAIHYTGCSGDRPNMSIDGARVEEVAQVHRAYFGGIREQDRPAYTAFQKETGRLSVSMLFLQQARSSYDFGQKIANYCSFFESLLSTNSSELSHQLSERAAFMMNTSPAVRLQQFKKMKRAYAIRSKVVHGDVVSKKQIPDLREIAEHCDTTARELLTTIMANDKLTELFTRGTNDAIDEFMLHRIFGVAEGE